MAHVLIGYGLLQGLLLLRMSRWIAEQPFGPSYWAFTFGATALAGAMVRLTPVDGGGAIAVLAPAVFVLANVVVLGVAAGTVAPIVSGPILPPAPAPISAGASAGPATEGR